MRAEDLQFMRAFGEFIAAAGLSGYKTMGRGAVVVDTLQSPHIMIYLTAEEVDQLLGDDDATRLVAEYDPCNMFVVVFLKDGAFSGYKMVDTCPRKLFELGQVVITPAARDHLGDCGVSPQSPLARHVSGDWGDLCQEDIQANDAAVRDGERILSSYTVGSEKVWIITEWDRSVTTILMPEDY